MTHQIQVKKFSLLFDNKDMIESSSGRVEIKDVPSDIMELLLRFIYLDNVAKEDITCDLLMAAERFNVESLVRICVRHLAENLTIQNVMNVMITGMDSNK